MSPTWLDTRGPVWTNPDADEGEPSLILLTAGSLLAARVPPEELDQAVAALSGGTEFTGQVISLVAVTKLEGDEKDPTLTVTYRVGKTKSDALTLTLKDAAAREELIAALTDRLGGGWRSRREPMTRWVAGGGTLLLLCLLAFAAWAVHREAVRIAEGGRLDADGRNFTQIVAGAIAYGVEWAIGPTGVLIVGVVLAALGLFAFAYIVAYPPVSVILEQGPVPEGEPGAAGGPAPSARR